MPTPQLSRRHDRWVDLATPPRGAHGVQFYEEDAVLCDSLARYLGAGLAAGEPAIAIVTPSHAHEIRTRLSALGFTGQHTMPTFLDARETLAGFMVGSLPDAELFEETVGRVVADHAARGSGTVRAFGEMVDLLWCEGNASGAIRLEELWHDLAGRHTFSLLCAYVLDDFVKDAGGQACRTICANHPHVFQPDGQPYVETRDAEIACLRERADALEAEVAHRKRLEVALRDALSDLRRSESALRESRQDLEDFVESAAQGLYELFMQAPVPICVLRGPELVFDMANDRYSQILAAKTGADELIGRPLGDAVPSLEGQGIEDLLREVLRTGRAIVRNEAPVRIHRDGSFMATLWTLTFAPLRNRKGTVDRVMVLATEVTDEVTTRRAMEDARAGLESALGERERLIEQLQANVRFSELFVGILGHDLRNPLMAIGTAAALLERRNDSEKCTKPLVRIQSSARRMARMIDQILDFTRLRIGKGFPLASRSLHLPDVFRSVLDELQAIDAGKCVQLEVAGDAVGTWDEDRLCQLVSNLAGNALQHRIPDSTVRIRIDGTKRDEVVVRFENEGTIPPALVPVLFEPFHGGREVKSVQSSGLGLGLFISQQIVHAHGGRILVESTEAAGTSFTVHLPRHCPASFAMEQASCP